MAPFHLKNEWNLRFNGKSAFRFPSAEGNGHPESCNKDTYLYFTTTLVHIHGITKVAGWVW